MRISVSFSHLQVALPLRIPAFQSERHGLKHLGNIKVLTGVNETSVKMPIL